MKMSKKFLAVLSAGAIMTSMAIPAFATEAMEGQDVTTDYQNMIETAIEGREERGIYKCEVTANHVNIRSGPGTNYKSLGQQNKGDIVYMHRFAPGDDGEIWAYCLCGYPNKGVYGYIRQDFLREVDDYQV